MIKRYEVKEITEIWSDENKFQNWLNIELLNCEALSKLKVIPINEINEIKKTIGFNINDVYEIEKETKHDVIAFTRAISKFMNNDVKKWIHYGLTSTDVVDTANAVALKQSNDIIEIELKNLKKELTKISLKHKYSYIIGRTHGMHAEITTFGLKILGWVNELDRHIKRFALARNDIEVGKISGAVGTYANTPPFVQEYICKKLKINSALFSTQIISRDNHSFYFDTLNNIGLSLDKWATELRHLHRTEIEEISEYFDLNQKGSSAMPHKKNPINFENICGLTRLLSGYALSANRNVNLWHERDISHSSVERIIFLDAINILVYVLRRFIKTISEMGVNKKKMLENIKTSNAKIFSGSILNYLIKNNNLSREDAYDKIQIITNKKLTNKNDFINEIEKSNLSKYIENIDELLSYDYHLKNIDYIYNKVLGKKK